MKTGCKKTFAAVEKAVEVFSLSGIDESEKGVKADLGRKIIVGVQALACFPGVLCKVKLEIQQNR
jgi:hypothetical protein